MGRVRSYKQRDPRIQDPSVLPISVLESAIPKFMNRYALFLVAVLLAGTAMPNPARAQVDVSVGPRLGVPVGDLSDDAGADVFLGGEARITAPALPVTVKPSLDIYFGDDDVSIFTIDLNAVYTIGIDNQVFTPYAGGGIGITSVDIDRGPGGRGDETELGLNLTGGARFLIEPVQPFVELNATIGGDFDRLGITGGVLYNL